MNPTREFGRRQLLQSLLATTVLVIAGCGAPDEASAGSGTRQPVKARPKMTVYRDPGCGCCEKWVKLAERAGFATTMIDHPDMAAVKLRHGVPRQLASCHTAIVDGYAIEGHVPFAAVARLLRERPALAGIAVPGMPRGSPGMEMPDGTRDAFQIVGFDRRGKVSVYSA